MSFGTAVTRQAKSSWLATMTLLYATRINIEEMIGQELFLSLSSNDEPGTTSTSKRNRTNSMATGKAALCSVAIYFYSPEEWNGGRRTTAGFEACPIEGLAHISIFSSHYSLVLCV